MDDQDPQQIGDLAVWLVKGFSVDMRRQITRAAKGRDCTVAEWLHGHFERYGIDGVAVTPVKLIAANPSPTTPAATTPVADLVMLVEAAARLAEAGDGMPKMLRAALAKSIRVAAVQRMLPVPVAPAADTTAPEPAPSPAKIAPPAKLLAGAR
jgi:hypothetical protein